MKDPHRRSSRRNFSLTLLALLILGSFLGGYVVRSYQEPAPPAIAQSMPGGFQIFWEAWGLLEQDFLGDQPSEQERQYAAIRGLINSYGDPYTTFIEPQPRQREREELQGHFGGIGVWIEELGPGHFVLHPINGQPAERAGIQPGDRLLRVNEYSVSPQTTHPELVDWIRGPMGSKAELEIERAGKATQVTVTIRREQIDQPSVEWRMHDVKGVGYLRIRLFSNRTPTEVRKALEELYGQGMRKLVLDLRHTPGGLLDTSIEVAGVFLPANVVVMQEQHKNGETRVRNTRHNGSALDLPVVILVNGATASGAEILAGALRDHGRARLVGTETFGKGSVQWVHDLSDGSSLHVTVARWLTPGGTVIDGQGLRPDILVESGSDTDIVLARAVDWLVSGR